MRIKAAPFISYFLPEEIYGNIERDFELVHLSGNLVDTMRGPLTGGRGKLEIPADTYDISLYRAEKVIVYNGIGSYASEVSKTGGFSGVHVGYDERAIDKAIRKLKRKAKGYDPDVRIFVRKYYE